jgi:hypothetical protein
VPFESVGPAIPIERLVRFELPKPVVSEGRLDTVITHVLIFGNLTFAGTPADLEAAIGPLRKGQRLIVEFDGGARQPPIRERTTWQDTFGDVAPGESLVMADSEGNLSFADNQGHAAGRLGLTVDRAARITAA